MKPNNRMNRSKRNSKYCLVEQRPWLQRIGGFTLIELVVVIAIIALLLALSVPPPPPTNIKCNSNLKNLYLILQMYADDHGGLFPNITDYSQVPLKVMEALKPYVNSDEIFWCPDDPEKSKHPGGSYDWRVTHDPKTTLSGVRLDLLRHPSRVIIAGERSAGWHKSGKINVLDADGHLDQVTEKEWWDNITTPLESL